MRWIIAYDIVDDRIRRKVIKELTVYSNRVQKSVFEGDVATGSVKELLKKLEKVIDLKIDSIRCYPVCANCSANMEIIGIGSRVEKLEYMIV